MTNLLNVKSTIHVKFPPQLRALLLSSSFWSKLKTASKMIKPILKCLVFLESDNSTVVGAYACIIFYGINLH